MGKTGINNNNLKQQNRGLILKLIATGECTSRIELSRKTGLSKMSVTNIISDFIKDGFIKEEDIEPVKGQGRNPITLTISDNAPKIAGLFIHREECVAVLCDMKLNILDKASETITERNSSEFPQIIFRVIDSIFAAGKNERIAGIGVGAVGPVDIEKGMILNPPNFFGIHDFEMIDFLKERYKMPVYLDSLNNCAAMAEKYYGLGRHWQDFIFVGITNGIGSGIISDDKIFRNSNGLTSELGHVSIDWQGNRCSCGNRGCLETYIGARVIEKSFERLTGEKCNFRQVCHRAQQGNQQADAILRDMAEKLACALTSAVNLLNPQAILIGHEGCSIPDVYLEYLEEVINARKLSGQYRKIKVKRPYFGEEAHLRGCVCPMLARIWQGDEQMGT